VKCPKCGSAALIYWPKGGKPELIVPGTEDRLDRALRLARAAYEAGKATTPRQLLDVFTDAIPEILVETDPDDPHGLLVWFEGQEVKP